MQKSWKKPAADPFSTENPASALPESSCGRNMARFGANSETCGTVEIIISRDRKLIWETSKSWSITAMAPARLRLS